MFQRLVSHNPDLSALIDKGYALAFDSTSHLVIRDIPYLDGAGDLQWGAFVAKLVFVDQEHVQQDDHQVYFAGSHPHGLDGAPLPNLAGGASTIALSDRFADVAVQRSFSNKPKRTGAFSDFFEKIESYTAIVSGPAMEKHAASPYTFRVDPADASDPIFKFQDTLTSRAEIGELAAKLENDVVAVIGLGGTGSYVLDYLVKTRVKEIRGFDGDAFHVHNAYRAPGRTDPHEFGKAKADVFRSRYENFRRGLTIEKKFIDETSTEELAGVTFAFVCVDKGTSRARIFDALLALSIPFIDVGMGLRKRPEGLTGSLRATQVRPETAELVLARGVVPLADDPDDMYRANIQIPELNSLNAALAVIKYKQLRGFFRAGNEGYHHIFSVAELKLYEDALE